jgi:hydrogenase-4 component E
MINILLITFAISLIYIAIANRLLTYIRIIAFQGLVLFGVAFIELIEINVINLIFVLLETIVIKAVAIPYFLRYILERNKITREAEPFVSNFVSVVIVTIIIIGSFFLTYTVHDTSVRKIFFTVALSALFTGLYIIITRRKIITHVMGYLVIENGVFVLSLTVGSEMPMIVNTGILLDVFVSVILLGIFADKIGDVFEEQDVEQLRNLRD